MNNTVAIIGYSLDACVNARILANSGSKVQFLCTGDLGHPLDVIHDATRSEDVAFITSLCGYDTFRQVKDGSHVHYPYGTIKMVNTRNGLVSYPLNQRSFESADEWEETKAAVTTGALQRAPVKNLMQIYRDVLPKWLHEGFLKFIGINKWGGDRHGKWTNSGIAKEIGLEHLLNATLPTLYWPADSWKVVCQKLLDHPNISMTSFAIGNTRDYISHRRKPARVIIADNRIDHVFNYMHSGLSRIMWESTIASPGSLDELVDVSSGIIMTPAKPYWGVVADDLNVRLLSSQVCPASLALPPQSVLPPTLVNEKTLMEYVKMVSLFRGCELDLKLRVWTAIG